MLNRPSTVSYVWDILLFLRMNLLSDSNTLKMPMTWMQDETEGSGRWTAN